MTISKRLLIIFLALSIFATQTAQAFSSLTWQSQSGSGHNTETVKLAHAVAGCAAGAAKSDNCSSGALGAVVGEITAELYAPNNTGTPLTAKQQTDTINFSKMIAGVAAALTGNNVNVAAGAAGNAAENNWLNHNRPSLLALSEKERYDQAAKDCGSGNAAQCSVATNLRNLSNGRDRQLNLACAGAPSSTCAAAAKEAILAGNDVFTGPDGRLYATSKTLPALSNQNRPQGFDQKIAPTMVDGLILEAGNGVIAGVVKGGAAALEVLGLSARGAEVGADALASTATPESRALTPYYPVNDGFLGDARDFVLIPGAKVDRYGMDAGRFLAPEGTPIPMRSLSPGTENKPYSIFEVLKPIDVKAGEIAPAFAQPGLGTQFVPDMAIRDLLNKGYLKRVQP